MILPVGPVWTGAATNPDFLRAGANISIDTVGLHYNRKCIPVQKTHLGGLQWVAQRGIGKTRLVSNRKGSCTNGTEMLLSRSLGEQGLALDAGGSFVFKVKGWRSHHPNLGFSRQRGWRYSQFLFSTTR